MNVSPPSGEAGSQPPGPTTSTQRRCWKCYGGTGEIVEVELGTGRFMHAYGLCETGGDPHSTPGHEVVGSRPLTGPLTPSDDIHEFFGLAYSNYLVLHRTLMQSMPAEWQRRMVACLDQLETAFAHLDDRPARFIVTPAREVEYNDLTKAERRQLGVKKVKKFEITVRGIEYNNLTKKERRELGATRIKGAREDAYLDRDGEERDGYERVLVPAGPDLIPHYNRGRTYIAPLSLNTSLTVEEGDDERTNSVQPLQPQSDA